MPYSKYGKLDNIVTTAMSLKLDKTCCDSGTPEKNTTKQDISYLLQMMIKLKKEVSNFTWLRCPNCLKG